MRGTFGSLKRQSADCKQKKGGKIAVCRPIGCLALNLMPLFPKLPIIDHFNRMCAAMDFNPIATPVRLANGEIHIHACIHHSLPNFMVRS
ncbi:MULTISPECIES: hypothetical protein [Rhizobium]|uniref:hypothetical protein n=1 Tax=Rhizobium TaxID=379 RepID=UPI00104034EF|nr:MULTISPECIES: hypothetical protein [Rhizobium]NKL80445.1 hypothetical protein [Rhizobium leguminosarum bv. viciae]TBY01566.1 hypothetical protein E0J21_27555 [Rhizobium laguerreae]